MSRSRDSWVVAATVFAESAWLFAVLGVAGIALGLDSSPLGWPAVLTILGAAALAARIPSPSIVVALASGSLGLVAYGSLDGPLRWLLVLGAAGLVAAMALRRPLRETSVEANAALKALFGAGVAYLMIASGVTLGEGGFDLGWLSVAFREGANPEYRMVAVMGLLVSAALWWRGGSLVAKEFPIESHVLSFRLGVFALAAATTIDIVHPADLGTFPMVFTFFATGLAGLGIGHLLPESRQAERARTWPKVLGAAVASVLAAGIIFSFMGRDALGFISKPALSTFSVVVDGIFWGLLVPISTAWNLFLAALLGIIKTVFSGLAATGLGDILGVGPAETATEALAVEDDGELLYFVVQVLEWALIAAVSVFLIYAVYRLLRHVLARGSGHTLGRRESLRNDADLKSDVGRLLSQLVPGRGRGRLPRSGFTLPDAPPGIVDVLRVYYAMLTAAEDLGYRRRRCQTPAEFQPVLETLFPRPLVRSATTAFVNACYGNYPATEAQIMELSASVKRIGNGSPRLLGPARSQPDRDLRST